MAEGNRRSILVGFDGSVPSRRAARWAVAEAASTDRPVQLAYVFRWPIPELAQLHVVDKIGDVGDARQAAGVLIDAAVRGFEELAPGVDVRGELVTGGTVEIMTSLAADAELLVLGASGQSGISQVLLGSSAAELARRVTSSIVIVRGVDEDGRGPVVVGVDGSVSSDRVVQFGFDFAARHGREVVAVHTWCDLPIDALSLTSVLDLDRVQVQKESDALLTDLLADARRRHPEVPVHHVTSVDRPAQALLDLAAGAGLLVVGRHGRARTEAPLGSVSHAVLHYAPCPVAVVAE
ncbi:universal stress protein [Pseudonocardia asaccharolytica]|uniref:Universal stress protein n=1 Tax=Pseudonocardia asaccharolytica DSM 44247 = NBRC 16224 TaxID=1123024 RepID=A0A511D205_9PSEU|nr:universal stress protein [Pseudonocardia asaccharolytica]GEL18809.1 universal stress protein [Pseudonocardia asaccharolytica DSM 44247 = NBRC 16224]